MWSTIARTLRTTIEPTHLSRFEFHKSARRLAESVVLKESTIIKKSKGFSEDEESLIVATINKCTETDFDKYDIKKSELKRLMAYKEKYGKFETFNEILVIQDVPLLIKLCRSILDGGKRRVMIKSTGPSKCTTMPAIDKLTRQSIKTIVGIRIWGNMISWAALDDRELIQWECETYESPPKSNLIPLLNLIISIIDKIPYADAYVMEAEPYAMMSKLKAGAYQYHVQRQQVIATIVSILGTRRLLNASNDSTAIDNRKINNFYTLAPLSSAKRFNLTVANDIMSSESLIKDILEGNIHNKILNFPEITVNSKVIIDYKSYDYKYREQLHSALLITFAFADIIYDDAEPKAGQN
ncbi:transcription elongation factor, mitochondrial [Microplitis mediator]|uniref:transcription elongation factor, mitochondrial n=1 Tax=Microplitis mediator TaxID=375433 RepID=UPI002553416C|nr:transcription elongation factor, mitochondrial [Microplitis mediator]